MKVVVFNGSPRNEGNTRFCLEIEIFRTYPFPACTGNHPVSIIVDQLNIKKKKISFQGNKVISIFYRFSRHADIDSQLGSLSIIAYLELADPGQQVNALVSLEVECQ